MRYTGRRETTEKTDSKRIGIYIANTVIIASAIALLIFATGWLKEGLVAAQAAEQYEVAKEEIVSSKGHEINFSAIHTVGSEITSWLYIPGTGIDYPLVQGSDNDYFIDHDAYGNTSKAGAIFLNYSNSPSLTDPKSVIFGHNMRDGSMFSKLHNYESEAFGREHTDAYIYLDNGTVNHYKLRYYIFTDPSADAIYLVSPEEETTQQVSASLEDIADITYDHATGGNLICLSTCTNHIYRTVVVFELVDHKRPITGVSEKMSEQGMDESSLKDEE